MKIDLHCHTLAVKQGENIKRNVTADVFASKLVGAGVKIVGITNHNKFDREQFEKLSKKVGDNIQVWPGIELDIKSSNNKDNYHLIVISSPEKTGDFAKDVDALIGGQSPDDFRGDIDDIIKRFEKYDSIFLPHFHKDPSISEVEFDMIGEKLKNKKRLIAESTNLRSMSIFIGHGVSSIVGSDIKDWDNYPNKELPELRLGADSYKQFCLLLDRDPTAVKTILERRQKRDIIVNPCENRDDTKETHTFYNEVNVIMGDKGTGKTQVIKSIQSNLDASEEKISVYIGSELTRAFDEMHDTSGMERLSEKIGINNHKDDFSLIQKWGDKTPEQISNYITFHKTKTDKEQQKRIQWSKSNPIKTGGLEKQIKGINNDLQFISSARDSIAKVDINKYVSASDAAILVELLKKLADSTRIQIEERSIELYATKLTNHTLKQFKDRVSVKTGTASKPSGTGFYDFASNRAALNRSMRSILDVFDYDDAKKELKNYRRLGSIGDKGDIYLESRHKILNDTKDKAKRSADKEYERNITDLRDAKKQIERVGKRCFSIDLCNRDGIEKLKSVLQKAKVTSFDEFVGLQKQTVNQNKEPYLLSNGERSILLMQMKLNEEADVYLLDEPELGMANSYIDEVIRPRITDIGKQNKMVIIATHNANLAVRTLPYTTMYRTHDGRGYQTYIGNPFTNNLVNIKDDADTREWKDVSLKILEGGKDAFYDRKEIYGKQQ